ncbi:fimbrillin family protein [Bacteroides congonensis]|uniref:fimbrillin family protein n=3 Tax=Bacteroides congonensis TaxID=1871006 RepID=UPI0023F87191|nr:fimbrillin family protein [Bacteroides congonensis]
MKLGKFLFTGSLSLFALAACVSNDDKSEWNDGSQAINFTSSIQGLNTRAANAEWTAGDKVGIFMKAANGDLSAATAANKLHTTDKNGNLTASNAENALYYPTDGSSVDFVAYYPYVISLPGNTYKVDVTTQTDKPAIDLLYSDNAKGFAKGASGSPQLTFTHMLSQIVFNIEKDATIPTLDGLKVTFKGMNTKADFTLADGKLINAGTVADITSLMAEGATTITTIVLPATTLSDIKVVFDLNGKSYTADYPQTVLDAGRKYVHKVKLSDSNGQPVIVMEAATITDWIEVPGGDIDVDFGGGVTPPEPIEGVEVTTDKPYNETFADGQGEFTINNVTEPVAGNSVWNHDAGYHYMVASGRVGEVDYNSEGWLVSPVLKLADAKTATLTFEHAFKFGSSADLTLQVKEVGQTTWTAVAIPTYPTGSDWNFVSSGDIDLSGYVNKSIQIAFKYTSTPSSSAKWEIKNIKLTLKDNDDPDPTPTGNLVQNPGFEDWTGDLAASWDNSYNTPKAGITKSTDIKHSGNNALKQVSASSTSKIQQEVAITGGKTYRISYWFLDNDTKASTRMWSSWISGSTVLTDNKAELQQEAYSKENADWQQVTLTLKAPVTADKFRFEVRTYKQSADNLGGFIYYDDFEIVEVTQ